MISVEHLIILVVALGVVFGFLRIFIQVFHEKKNTVHFISEDLPLIFFCVGFAPMLLDYNYNFLAILLIPTLLLVMIWYFRFKKQILPSFSQFHWIYIPGTILLLLFFYWQEYLYYIMTAFPVILFLIFLVIVTLAAIAHLLPLFWFKVNAKLLIKYTFLLSLNMILAILLLIPVIGLVDGILINEIDVNIKSLLIIFLAASYLSFPVLAFIYFFSVSREEAEKHIKFIKENKLYKHKTGYFRYIQLLFSLVGIIGTITLRLDPLFIVLVILNLSFI